MHRSAYLLCLLAGFNLVLAPFMTPHAHIHGGHGDVFVHGGHQHLAAEIDFHDDSHHPHDVASNSRVEAHDRFEARSEKDDRHDYEHVPEQGAAGREASAAFEAHAEIVIHAHLVQLDGDAIDRSARHLDDLVAPIHAHALARAVAGGQPTVPLLRDPDRPSRNFLHPPLRGPPSLIPQIV